MITISSLLYLALSSKYYICKKIYILLHIVDSKLINLKNTLIIIHTESDFVMMLSIPISFNSLVWSYSFFMLKLKMWT